jgi:hypothetical protein
MAPPYSVPTPPNPTQNEETSTGHRIVAGCMRRRRLTEATIDNVRAAWHDTHEAWLQIWRARQGDAAV